jgi:hypothetical protein
VSQIPDCTHPLPASKVLRARQRFSVNGRICLRTRVCKACGKIFDTEERKKGGCGHQLAGSSILRGTQHFSKNEGVCTRMRVCKICGKTFDTRERIRPTSDAEPVTMDTPDYLP